MSTIQKTYIIAEIAQGFEGDYNLCRRFIKLAKDCSADAVKFQIFKASELCTEDYKYNELFKNLEIAPEKWGELIRYAQEIGIDFYADIYGAETFEWISKEGLAGIKIHSTDLKNYRLLKLLQNKGIKILLASGGSALEELKKAIEVLKGNDVCIMSGFQAEPNLYGDVELDKIGFLSKEFGLKIGYADHIDAKDPLATILPSMAVLKGASVIEKHLTIDRDNLMLEDYVSALNADEFRKMVDLVRSVEQFSQTGEGFPLSEREEKYRKNTKKAVLAATDIKAGTLIAEEHLAMLRTGKEVSELIDLEYIVGKTAATDIVKEQVIKRADLN